jgi:hypothetical protein
MQFAFHRVLLVGLFDTGHLFTACVLQHGESFGSRVDDVLNRENAPAWEAGVAVVSGQASPEPRQHAACMAGTLQARHPSAVQGMERQGRTRERHCMYPGPARTPRAVPANGMGFDAHAHPRTLRLAQDERFTHQTVFRGLGHIEPDG